MSGYRDLAMAQITAYQIVLWILSGVTALAGVAMFVAAPAVTQEIAALLVLVMSAVFATGAMLAGVLQQFRLDLRARALRSEPMGRPAAIEPTARVSNSLSDAE